MYKNIKIIYDSALDEYIFKLLEKHEIEKYMKVPQVEAAWKEGVKHLNSHIWPGTDAIVLVILEDQIAKLFIEDLKKLKAKTEISFNVMISTIEELI